MKKIITATLIALLFGTAAFAQQAVVTGAVLDSLSRDGEPAAIIQFFKAPDFDKPVAFTTTDTDGKFSQTLSEKGNYSCLVALFINQQLRKYGGDLAIGGYGIINRITMLFIMICMGFNQGLQPIAGYNYGARQYSRVKEVFILTAKWEVLVTTLCFLVSELIPTQAVSLFTNDPELIRMASKGIKTMNLAFALVGFGMVSGNFFQCLGMVKKSIFLSLTRQLIFLLPLLYTLPIWFEDKGVWMSFPISDSLNIIISAILIINLFRKFNKLNDGDDPATLGSTIS